MAGFAGLYEVAEAVRYLRATAYGSPPNYQAVRRWVRSGLPAPEACSVPVRELFLVFLDLISLRMVVTLRQAGFSLQHIRRVHQWLQRETGYERPFAIQELWISNTETFTEVEKRLLSATKGGQYAMDFVKQWLSSLGRPNAPLDMSFKRNNGFSVVSSWRPKLFVMLDPLVQFGAPCIEGTRIPTRAVWSMVHAGDAKEAIARAYGVPLIKVESALEWEEGLAAVAP